MLSRRVAGCQMADGNPVILSGWVKLFGTRWWFTFVFCGTAVVNNKLGIVESEIWKGGSVRLWKRQCVDVFESQQVVRRVVKGPRRLC